MVIPQGTEKVVVDTDSGRIGLVRCRYYFERKFSSRAIYLHFVLDCTSEFRDT